MLSLSIALKDQEIQDKDETVAQKDQEIIEQLRIIGEKDTDLKEYRRVIEEKDHSINAGYKLDYFGGVHQPNYDHCCTSTWCTNREVLIDKHDDQVERSENMFNESFRHEQVEEKENVIRDLRDEIEVLKNKL